MSLARSADALVFDPGDRRRSGIRRFGGDDPGEDAHPGQAGDRAHVPALVDATIASELMHRLQHLSFLVTALFFWWAIIRRPEREYGLGAAYVFATMGHTGLLGALLTRAPRVFYPLQTHDAALFGFSPLQDQACGA